MLTSVADALDLIARRIHPLAAEWTSPAAGGVLAEAIVAPVDLPSFQRAAMDGFAVRSTDGPVDLHIRGEARPGKPFEGVLASNEAVRITTGAAIPRGADAVVMIEHTQPQEDMVRILDRVVAGKHVIRVGEDVAIGQTVLPSGRVLRPQDVGLLAALGISLVKLVRSPRVVLLVTGSELVPPGSMPTGTQVIDSHSPMLAALLQRDGCGGLAIRHIADDFESLRAALAEASLTADLILMTGGTSKGHEDHAAGAVRSLGELAIHGVAIRPAKPMGIGFLPCPMMMLPGNPVACLCAYELFAGRVVRRLAGRAFDLPHRRASRPLAERLVSQAGRLDYVRVKLIDDQVHVLAIGGASSLRSTVEADGFVLVPNEVETIEAGQLVEVHFYD